MISPISSFPTFADCSGALLSKIVAPIQSHEWVEEVAELSYEFAIGKYNRALMQGANLGHSPNLYSFFGNW